MQNKLDWPFYRRVALFSAATLALFASAAGAAHFAILQPLADKPVRMKNGLGSIRRGQWLVLWGKSVSC